MTADVDARPSSTPSAWTRIAVTVAAVAAYRLAAHVPLPGVEPAAYAPLIGDGGAAVERVSAVALGVMPAMFALALLELLRLILGWRGAGEPASAARREAHPPFSWFHLLTVATALYVAVTVAGAMQEIAGLVPEPGPYFLATAALSMVAGSLLLLWLADIVTVYGTGSGIWLMTLVPSIISSAKTFADYPRLVATGGIANEALGLLVLYAVIAVAAVAAVSRAWTADGALSRAAGLIWPVVLAYWVLEAGVLLAWYAGLATYDELSAQLLAPGGLVRLAILAALTAGVWWLTLKRDRPHEARLFLPSLGALLFAVVGAELLMSHAGLPLTFDGRNLIMLAVAGLVTLRVIRAPG